MSEHRLFAQRVGLVGIINLLVGISGTILLPILTKSISIEDYGLWVQISVTIGLIPVLVSLGLPYAMVRFLASAENNEDIREDFYSIFFIILLISAVISYAVFSLSRPIAEGLFNGQTPAVELLALVVFIECIYNLLINYFRTFQQIKKYSAFAFIKTYLGVVLVGYMVLSGYGILGAIIGLLAAGILISSIMFALIVSSIGIAIPKFRRMREYLAFGVPTIPGYVSTWIIDSSNRYVIGILLGSAYAGYYSPGYVLGNLPVLLVSPISFILPAALSKYYDEGDIQNVQTMLRYSFKFFLALAIPSVFGISMLSRPILEIISTPEIASRGYMVTPFIALSSLFVGMYGIVFQVMVLKKSTRITGAIWILTATVNLVLNVVLISLAGIIGAAVATLLSYALACLLTIYYSNKSMKLDLDIRFMVKCILSSTIMSLFILVLSPDGKLSILGSIGIGAISYFIILYILKGFDRAEISFIKVFFGAKS